MTSKKPPLLAVAAFLGIGVPGATLLLYHVEGWSLPTWLAVALPIILIGSTRGTAVLLGWKALRWATPRVKALRRSRDS
jgi:uncharacterized membrane protein